MSTNIARIRSKWGASTFVSVGVEEVCGDVGRYGPDSGRRGPNLAELGADSTH